MSTQKSGTGRRAPNLIKEGFFSHWRPVTSCYECGWHGKACTFCPACDRLIGEPPHCMSDGGPFVRKYDPTPYGMNVCGYTPDSQENGADGADSFN